MTLSWTSQEVEITIHSYFEMLCKELKGEPYRKAQYRRHLLPLLNHRSAASIEYKFQNISAILIKLNLLYIKGYKPAFNFQGLLQELVIKYIQSHQDIMPLFDDFVVRPYLIPKPYDFDSMLKPMPKVKEPLNMYSIPKVAKRDYLKLEQQNRTLGENGEEIIFKYEKWRLQKAGKSNLSDQVEWVSKERGDGAGFDILSRYENGKDKYIEVKTTRLGALTPIYFSRNEYEVSKNLASDYHLYRVYNYLAGPEFFVKSGDFDTICDKYVSTYRGSFNIR